ncbi:class I SAM-dependent methyltransferase [bacterium]|nr:class I SAM-dependent methyltransferase [candidate division CSSED10-310 bacterium]
MKYSSEVKRKALDDLKRSGPALTHQRMAELTGTNRKVLDMGCATGYVSKLMKDNGCTVVGIELDAEAVEEARSFCDSVICGDAGDQNVLRQAGTGFDAVICGDILEHLPDPVAVLGNLKECLVPGGFILVAMPNIAYWHMRWHLLTGKFEYGDTGLLDRTHLRFFTFDSFQKLARESGYAVTGHWINESGFPGSRILGKIPGLRGFTRHLSGFLANWRPNLFSYHSIFRLEPDRNQPANGQ